MAFYAFLAMDILLVAFVVVMERRLRRDRNLPG